MNLPIRDILLLDFFNGKPVHTKIPEFQKDIYGQDGESRIHDLCDEGWIRHSRPQETVNMLPDKALSDFLIRHGLDGTGTHVELVRRVLEHIPETEYAHAVPKVFIATSDGQNEMSRHMPYILNVRGNYGLTEGEIGDARRKLSLRSSSFLAQDVLYEAFQQKAALFTMAGEWTKLRNLYFTMANFFVRSNKMESALSYLSLVVFLDLSGMENKNCLCRYENLFPTQKGIIILMQQLRQELSINDSSMKSFFLSSIARLAPRLPFSYFSPQTMGDIFIDRLRGLDFDKTRYIPYRNVPDPDAGAYHYVSSPSETAKETRQNSSSSETLLIQRRMTPPVPPVFRLPDFTPVPPFRPRQSADHETKPVSLKKIPVDSSPDSSHLKKKGCLFSFILPLLAILMCLLFFG